MRALIYKSTGSWYTVKEESGKIWNARIKGIFKIDGITSTNPLAVGDRVDIVVEDETSQTALITAIEPRHNYINRQSPRVKHQHQIIAANIDQSILVTTLREPRTSQGFIDRFLVVSEAYHIPSVLVFNKADLYKEKEMQLYEKWKAMYEQIGYRVILVSIQHQQGLVALQELVKNKISLLSGHSGVGKSSLLNQLIPELQLRTQEVSGWSGKGLHTTTFAEMFDLPDSGKIIDTPGIRELGLVDIGKQELSHYFPEMRKKLTACQFNNCLHVNEPGCAVHEGVREGLIHEDRYVSYINILDSLEGSGKKSYS
ncbi:MAG: ribosome small subunit-dependent GTPase A [Chitinophagaceae bacterium]